MLSGQPPRAADNARHPKQDPLPRKRLRLPAKGVQKLLKDKRPGRYPDGDGLYLQITKNGASSWILRTVVQGRRRDIGLGGAALTSLAEAREKAIQLRKIARDGGDPIAARNKQRALALSFAKAAATVHEEHKKSWKNRKHAQQWMRTLEQYTFPVIGESPVDVIHSEHIVRALNPIWLTKPETARRVLQRISMVLLWAKGCGHRTDSPTDEIAAARRALPRQNDVPRHHKALAYAELPAFLSRLRGFSTSEPIKLAFEFLILTATRTNEVLGASWREIDLPNRVWTIPGHRMKAKYEHAVPLSDRCVEILTKANGYGHDADDFVFPSSAVGRPLSNMAFLMVLRRMGLDITAHGFRSTFRVWCAEQTSFSGAVAEVAEAALAHRVKDATEAAYMRSTLFDRRRPLMEAWSQFAGSQCAAAEGDSPVAANTSAKELANV